MNRLIELVEKPFLRKPGKFCIGDTVDVHVKIIEGVKERIQIFTGIVIARRGQGTGETFTVRRIVAGEGVERVFAICSPRVATIKVKKRGRTRRAKLYFLRNRVGKGTRLKEIQRTRQEISVKVPRSSEEALATS